MMKHLKKHIHRLIKDESGQGTTEYILILVGIVGLAFIFREQIQGIVKSKFTELGGSIQSFTPQ